MADSDIFCQKLNTATTSRLLFKMKSIATLITLCFAAVVVVDSQNSRTFGQFMAYHTGCVAETGVEIETLRKMWRGEQIFDDKANCYAACMLKRFGIMRPDGSIDVNAVRSKMPPYLSREMVDKIINDCKPQAGMNSCEAGGMIFRCIRDNGSLLSMGLPG